MAELTVGKDSYVSLEEANQYIADHYASTDSSRVQWEALSPEDQMVYLRKAAATIESLPLVGRKADVNQVMQFPRYIGGCSSSSAEIPQEVKSSQCEQALYFLGFAADPSLATTRAVRADLQKQGVSSYTIGDLSETFGGGTLGGYLYTTSEMSNASLTLMSKWLGGGFRVCRSCRCI